MQQKTPGKRIITMNVSSNGFRKIRANPERIQFALRIFDLAECQNIDCLCFPSGYLTVGKIDEIIPLLVPITRKAQSLRISFVLGIDLSGILQLPVDANSPEFMRIVRNQKIPCLLASFNSGTNKLFLTRQRSCTGEHTRQKLVTDDIMRTPRTMDLGGASFQIIYCGEVFDRRLFSKGMPKAGIIFGHRTMPRLARTMNACSKNGFSLLNTEHRSGKKGLLFSYDRGVNRSKRCDVEIIFHKDLWADIAVWKLNDKGLFRPARFDSMQTHNT